jgi:hypothetical protein
MSTPVVRALAIISRPFLAIFIPSGAPSKAWKMVRLL